MIPLKCIEACVCDCMSACAQTEAPWVEMYSGPGLEHVCGDLRPTTSYSLRVHCLGAGGQSQVIPVACCTSRFIPNARVYLPEMNILLGNEKKKFSRALNEH